MNCFCIPVAKSNTQNATTTSSTASDTENPTTAASTTTAHTSTSIPTTVAASTSTPARGIFSMILGKGKDKAESKVNKKKDDSASTSRIDKLTEEIVTLNLRNEAIQKFRFNELKVATNNFKISNILGQGGFGNVYRGYLPTKQVVAIKRLSSNGEQGTREFTTEVETLSIARHKNIVRLIGYCVENEHRLLVYEYMNLRSLEDHLLGHPRGKEIGILDWNTRIKIATETAKGVEYLHDKMNPHMIYGDLKSSNILLGDGYSVKLSDFGYARLGPTHISPRVFGTIGYCDPDYLNTGILSFKSDIYSFGVVLLELISGRRAFDGRKADDERNIVKWARPILKDRNKFKEIVDPSLQDKYPERDLQKVVDIAALCVQEDSEVRPDISRIVEGLEALNKMKSQIDEAESSRAHSPPSVGSVGQSSSGVKIMS